jgi:uncharacterized PurR-regulated membrane protein YhhQ (DUF165 family)
MPFSTPKNKILYVFFGFFVANAVIAELISVKLFDFGAAVGLQKDTYIMALGLLPWPIVFLATDAVNEFYGKKIVRQLSIITSILLIYVFGVIYVVDHLNAYNTGPEQKFISATESSSYPEAKQVNDSTFVITTRKPGVTDEQFHQVYAQSGFLIFGSVIAFLIGQLVDITMFGLFKRWTKGRFIWLRATGSTLVSQAIDTVLVIGIGFYLPGYVNGDQYLNMVMTGYFIKIIFAIGLTPLIYLVHYLMKKVFKLESVKYEKA